MALCYNKQSEKQKKNVSLCEWMWIQKKLFFFLSFSFSRFVMASNPKCIRGVVRFRRGRNKKNYLFFFLFCMNRGKKNDKNYFQIYRSPNRARKQLFFYVNAKLFFSFSLSPTDYTSFFFFWCVVERNSDSNDFNRIFFLLLFRYIDTYETIHKTRIPSLSLFRFDSNTSTSKN